MPKRERIKTKYPGIVYVTVGGKRVYYMVYRRKGENRQIEERAFIAGKTMTPALANQLRTERIKGKALTNKEQREARKAEKEAETKRMTISKLWDHYLENKGGKLKSRAADTSRFANYLKPILGDKEPGEIIELDIDRLKRKVLSGKSEQTVKHVLSLLRRIARYGVKKRLAQGLTFNIEMPEVENEIIETLNHRELARLIKVLDESEDIQIAGVMKLALFTGMRRGEIFKLRWKDVDFEKGFIYIRSPKGKKPVHIPMNEPARAVLKSHPCLSEHVFINERGKPFVDPKKRIEAIRTAAGLPKGFRPMHGLRHVYASILASSGKVDIYTLQRLLTHKSTSTTSRYAHLLDDALKSASNVIAGILTEVKKGK